MHYIIDGYNLLFHCAEIQNLETSREELLQFLLALSLPITIIFDGRSTQFEEAQKNLKGSVEIVYTAKGRSADDYILEELAALLRFSKTASPLSSVRVVTSDLSLAKKCRSLGASTSRVEEFFAHLEKKKRVKKAEKLSVESSYHFARLLKAFEEKQDP